MKSALCFITLADCPLWIVLAKEGGGSRPSCPSLWRKYGPC